MDSNQAASNLTDGKELWGATQNGRLFFLNEERLNYNSFRCTTQSFNICIPYKTVTKLSPATICYPYICNIITILLTIFSILYITYLWVAYFITGSLCFLTSLTYFTHPSTFPLAITSFFSVSMNILLFYSLCSFALMFRFYL